jgi:uncharacterized protein DUF397
MNIIDSDRESLAWRTSTFSGGGGCVEVTPVGDKVAVRHSRRPDQEVIVYSAAEWSAFIDGAKKGEFDNVALGVDIN